MSERVRRAREAFAAAHVVADSAVDSAMANTPGGPAAVDWNATMAYRHHLWDLGLGVADAMDTAQRGMGLDWPTARELIERSGAEARSREGVRLACGVNTDQLIEPAESLDAVIAAYLEQLEIVEAAGAQPIVMASRALAKVATGREDYHAVYGRVLREASGPVILHWLGTTFDPQLAGYWSGVPAESRTPRRHDGVPDGGDALDDATRSVLDLIAEYRDVVDGVKVSLLDADLEVHIRRRLPGGVRLYTGDDFNYPALIRGDEHGYSDALLGVFDAIAPIASRALVALDDGDADRFSSLLDPTVPLARHLFAAPTFHYKTGIVFLAWLSGHQRHFAMVGGAQSCRSPRHLLTLAAIADELGLFPDPDLAAHRLRIFREVTGHA